LGGLRHSSQRRDCPPQSAGPLTHSGFFVCLNPS
jgi:hypothetical protein